MRVYRDVWLTATVAAAVVGVWAALAFTVAVLLATFVTAWLLGSCALLLIYENSGRVHGRGWVLAHGAAIGVAAVAVTGFLSLLGSAAWLLVLAPVVSSPHLVRWVRDHCRRRMHESAATSPTPLEDPTSALAVLPEPSPQVVPRVTPATMDLEELCWAWRRSYVRLQRCRTVVERAQVVAERQQCLDEMERRNPGGLTTWLRSGARAAGDPTRYVTPAGPTGCRDNAA